MGVVWHLENMLCQDGSKLAGIMLVLRLGVLLNITDQFRRFVETIPKGDLYFEKEKTNAWVCAFSRLPFFGVGLNS